MSLQAQRPIGYWLKLVDERIESAFERVLNGHRLSRRHWQALNTFDTEPLDESGLVSALRPFWDSGPPSAGDLITDLTSRGWISLDGGQGYVLTGEGESARASIAAEVAGIRSRAATGITPEEYETTTRTLRRMAANLHAQT